MHSRKKRRWHTIYLYSCQSRQTVPVTDGWYTSSDPTFSADGKYLFFVSNRTFNPNYGQTEFNYTYQDMAKIYLVTLARDTRSPFEPKSDEVKPLDSAKAAETKDAAPPGKEVQVTVDPEGIRDRIAELPVAAGAYRNLASVGDKLFYVRMRGREQGPKLIFFEFDKQKETEAGDFTGYEISADGKKMLVSQAGGSYAIIDVPTGKADVKERLDLSDMKMKLDRNQEWLQIYNECWRQMRDFFYDPDLHGIDWGKVKRSYEPLVAHVRHRADLTYIIGEMIGELSAGHTYVGGGDVPAVARVKTGLLGARVERDTASGYFRISKILKGQNWDKNVRSPLTDIGVNAKEGDYILAVNGRSTNSMKDIYESLVNTVGKQVRLKLNAEPRDEGSRETVVIPIGDERPLFYYEWVQGNLEKVSRATNGRVGYIHVPDMGAPGLNEFVKYYYPQLRREALIIDVRGNGGGNVSPMLIERLRREAAMIGIARNTAPTLDPGGMIMGPKVCLLDEFSASDGDIFPYRFRQYKLGQAHRQAVVGRRRRDPRNAPDRGWRVSEPAGIFALRHCGKGMDHGGARRRP